MRTLSDKARWVPGPRVTKRSGNVFADLCLPDAEERLVKATVAIEIDRILTRRTLTQRATAELVGIDQTKVSQLVRGGSRATPPSA